MFGFVGEILLRGAHCWLRRDEAPSAFRLSGVRENEKAGDSLQYLEYRTAPPAGSNLISDFKLTA